MLKISKYVLATILCVGACAANASAAMTIVKDGKAQATIVIPDNPTNVVQFAVEELRYHIKESTGAELPVVEESAKPSGAAIIYLGPCKATLDAGIDPLSLAPNAFKIKLSNGSLFMAGRDSNGDIMTQPQCTTCGCLTKMGTLFAVYEFLEKQLGIKWVWPGKLGEIIPKHKSVVVKKWDQTWVPQLIHMRLRDDGPYHGVYEDWSSVEARKKFFRDQSIWLRRQKFAMGVNMSLHHAFTEHWNRFGKTHPEYFNLNPDGTRRPDPTWDGGLAGNISMCPSSPSLWNQIVEDWKAMRTEEIAFIDASENDTFGKCTCEGCMAWDVPDPKNPAAFSDRLERINKAFKESNDPKDWASWAKELGSLSDRYAKFYLAVQKEAQKVDPNAVVMGLAYANYWQPPIKTKLNEKIIIAIVPTLTFPWSDEKREEFRMQWEGWAASGCKLMLRPNYTLEGQCMPIFYARKFGEDFKYAAKRGLIATDFDSLTGQYAAQGPSLYMVARIQAHPELSVEKILDEYYSAFGLAKDSVKAYFSFWESITNKIDEQFYMAEWKKAQGESMGFYHVASKIFTPEVMAKGWALLKTAKIAASGDADAEQRVAFLEKGLKNAELTLKVQDAYVKHKETGNVADYARSMRELDAFRASVEKDNVVSKGFLNWTESLTWNRQFMRLHKDNSTELSDEWKFNWDPENIGEKSAWNTDKFDTASWYDIRVDSTWQQQEPGKEWIKQHNGSDYIGFAWYRTAFTIDQKNAGKKISLLFGAVDEACKIWLNGKQILERPFPYKGNTNSWLEAFNVDITGVVRFDGPNHLSVQVENNAGAGGIWKSVWLEVSDSPNPD